MKSRPLLVGVATLVVLAAASFGCSSSGHSGIDEPNFPTVVHSDALAAQLRADLKNRYADRSWATLIGPIAYDVDGATATSSIDVTVDSLGGSAADAQAFDEICAAVLQEAPSQDVSVNGEPCPNPMDSPTTDTSSP